MRHLFILTALLLASQSVARAADGLFVYPPVSGLAASEHYRVRVRSASDGSKWQSAFAWETVCKTVDKKTDAYFDTLAGWTHAYVNFETAGAVEVEIARANGQPIRAAAVHPLRQASACSVKEGKVLVRLDNPERSTKPNSNARARRRDSGSRLPCGLSPCRPDHPVPRFGGHAQGDLLRQ
jgi:hypothetical protein